MPSLAPSGQEKNLGTAPRNRLEVAFTSRPTWPVTFAAKSAPGFTEGRGEAYDPSQILREAFPKRGRVTPPKPRRTEVGGEDDPTTSAPSRITTSKKRPAKRRPWSQGSTPRSSMTRTGACRRCFIRLESSRAGRSAKGVKRNGRRMHLCESLERSLQMSHLAASVFSRHGCPSRKGTTVGAFSQIRRQREGPWYSAAVNFD